MNGGPRFFSEGFEGSLGIKKCIEIGVEKFLEQVEAWGPLYNGIRAFIILIKLLIIVTKIYTFLSHYNVVTSQAVVTLARLTLLIYSEHHNNNNAIRSSSSQPFS